MQNLILHPPTTTRLFASATCKAFGNHLLPAVMQAQVFMYTCTHAEFGKSFYFSQIILGRLVFAHAMYALMNTWLTTTRTDSSLDAVNGGQYGGEFKCHVWTTRTDSSLDAANGGQCGGEPK